MNIDLLEHPAAPEFFIRRFLSDIEEECFRTMATKYWETCATRRGFDRCQIALRVGAKGLDISIDSLHERRRCKALVEPRQKLMAFSRIVSLETDIVNSWKGIGRAFKRDHATVIHATHKYGDQISSALRVRRSWC
jgi:chromosomal replication initiation ATPase DnaA